MKKMLLVLSIFMLTLTTANAHGYYSEPMQQNCRTYKVDSWGKKTCLSTVYQRPPQPRYTARPCPPPAPVYHRPPVKRGGFSISFSTGYGPRAVLY